MSIHGCHLSRRAPSHGKDQTTRATPDPDHLRRSVEDGERRSIVGVDGRLRYREEENDKRFKNS